MTKTTFTFSNCNLPRGNYQVKLDRGNSRTMIRNRNGVYYYYKNALLSYELNGVNIFIVCSARCFHSGEVINWYFYPRDK